MVILLVSDVVSERFGDRIRVAAGGAANLMVLGADGAFSGDPAQVEAAFISVDMLVSGAVHKLAAALPAMPKLRWVQTFSIGLDAPYYRTILDLGVLLTSGTGTQGKPITQHVFSLMLWHARRLGVISANQAAQRWQRVEADELTGRTLSLLGLGGIGQEVARVGKVFHMRVIGARRRPDPVPDVDEVLPNTPAGIGELCAQADYLVICAPLTEETRGVIGRAELARMKPTAFLINVARGPLVDETALVETLRAGAIAGAGLDVFATEPLPPDHPFWTLPNVLITPHMAPASPFHLQRGADLFIENLQRYATGQSLRNPVDPREVSAG